MKRVRQIVAWITIAVIVCLIVGTIICAVTGSKLFWGMLYLMMAVPVVLWVFMWFTRLVNGDSDVISKEDMEALEKSKKGTEPEQTDSVK